MISTWIDPTRPVYSASTGASDSSLADVECTWSLDVLVQGTPTAVEYGCGWTGSVLVVADVDSYVWECPQCEAELHEYAG